MCQYLFFGSIVIEEEVIARVSSWTIGMVEGLTSDASLVLFVPVCSDHQLDFQLKRG
jgi:hypothetical protein